MWGLKLLVSTILLVRCEDSRINSCPNSVDSVDHPQNEKWRRDSSSIYQYKSYNTQIVCKPADEIQYPDNFQHLQKIVQTAINDGITVKALGHLHSVTDLICTDGIPISLSKLKYFDYNEPDQTATFAAGMILQEALEFLEAKQRSLQFHPTYGGITLAGSMGTGAHGSSLLHPSSIADQMTSLEIINGTGGFETINIPAEVDAFKPHLGVLGIITKVTLRTVPLFKITTESNLEPESILLDGTALQLARSNDHIQMAWFLSSEDVLVIKGNMTSDLSIPGNSTTGLISDLSDATITQMKNVYEDFQKHNDIKGLFELEQQSKSGMLKNGFNGGAYFGNVETENIDQVKYSAAGIGWRMQTGTCSNGCFWDVGEMSFYIEEMSLGIDVTRLPQAVKRIKEIVKEMPASFPMVGIFLRFQKQSTGLMSIAYGRPTVVMEWVSIMRKNPFDDAKVGLATYQALMQELINKFDGRPHWGKCGLYYYSQDVIRKTSPNLEKFLLAMRKYDPERIFLNKFGNRLLGLSNEMDMDSNVKHCAMQDYCICTKDEDCANGQICQITREFSVCKDTN